LSRSLFGSKPEVEAAGIEPALCAIPKPCKWRGFGSGKGWKPSSSSARTVGRGAYSVWSDAGTKAEFSCWSSLRSDDAANGSTVCAWSTCRATTAACTSSGRRRPKGDLLRQPVRESPTWKAARPKLEGSSSDSLHGQGRHRPVQGASRERPPTRSRSFEGKVKGNGGRTGYGAQG
jgi:hypothetical protein